MNEENLIEARTGRQPDDLAALSERHRERLIRMATAILRDEVEAEDVAQEALLRYARAAVKDGAAVGAWLETTTRRIALDRMRSRVLDLAAREHTRRSVNAGGPTQVPLSAELPSKLERLGEPYRTAITLRYLEGLSFDEVARRMGTIERTARTWTGRGLQRLRDIWKGDADELS